MPKNTIYEQYGDQRMQRVQGTQQVQGNQQQTMPDPFGSVNGLQNQWNQFRQSYQGNAQQEVQQLLQSGKMSPQQLRMYQMIAQRIAPLLGGR